MAIVDAAQSASHIPIDVQAMGADFVAFTGHKLYGPSGVGVLWGRYDLLAALPPFLGGGEMIETVAMEGSTFAPPPHRFEAGTPMIAQAVALGTAIEFMTGLGMQNIAEHETAITAYALDELPEWPTELARDVRARRDLLCDGLGGIDGTEVFEPDGTYFVTSDVSALGWDDGMAFCQALPDRAGVVAIPSQVFHDDQRGPGRHLVRWAFCKQPSLIGEGVSRLAAADLRR